MCEMGEISGGTINGATITGGSISIDTEVGLTVLAIQELTKRNTDLNLRIFKLEKEINANE